MSQTFNARVTARRAAGSTTLEWLARAGYIGYGVTHLLIAWLALQIAYGRSTGAGDQGGALSALARQPLGRFLVIAIGVGLAAMAVWQALEAAVGHTGDQGKERVAERIGSAGRAIVYAYLAWTALKVFTDSLSSSASQQQSTSARLMADTGGRWLVGLVGVVILGIGVGMVWYGLVKRFEKHLRTGMMSPRTQRTSRALGMVGYTAKGVAYAIAGVLLITAAVSYDPGKARGLDGALRTLAEQPYGGLLLTLVALGFAAAGIFCFVQARYRKV